MTKTLVLFWFLASPLSGTPPVPAHGPASARNISALAVLVWCPASSAARSPLDEIRAESCTEPDSESEDDTPSPTPLPFGTEIPPLFLIGRATDATASLGADRHAHHSPLLRC